MVKGGGVQSGIMRGEWLDKYLNAEELHKINEELHEIDKRLRIGAVSERDGRALSVECDIEVRGNKEAIKKLKEKGWVKFWGCISCGHRKESYRLYLEEG